MNAIVIGQSIKMAEILHSFCNDVYIAIDNSFACRRNFNELNDFTIINSSVNISTPKGIIAKAIEIHKWIKRYNLDIIFSQTKYDMVASKLATLFSNKKIILLGTSHNSYAWLNETNVKRMAKLISFTTDYYIALASFVYNKLIAYGIPDKKIILLPNTVEYQNWSIKRDYSIKDNVIRIVYVAYLYEGKRQSFIVDVIRGLMSKSNYNIIVDCYGDLKDCNYVNSIKGKINNYSLENNIKLRGPIENSELKSILCTYDIYFCPTKMEMSPVNILEAQAASLPVVATNVGGIPDLIQDGVNGLLFEVDNINDACEKLLLLINNQTLREKLGKAGRDFVSKINTAENSGKKLFKIISSSNK